ncbi:hypothetical protein [Streptomyces sp. NPDC097619]|uniref:hypothetical protein n=1 Tax=Streptomyces sp. NPDC097619 TaxID=3157228 RepID=UPI00332C5671
MSTDYIGQIHPWITRYDEHRTDNSIDTDLFLEDLVAHLRGLVGPPLPGTAFTLTFAGHDGEKSYHWVVNGSDLRDAGRTLLRLPSFRQWYAELGPHDDGTTPSVAYVGAHSHRGLPAHDFFNDLRREQADTPAAPGDAPVLPPVPPLALLG